MGSLLLWYYLCQYTDTQAETRYLLKSDDLQVEHMHIGMLEDLFCLASDDERCVNVNCLSIALLDGFSQIPNLVRCVLDTNIWRLRN